MKTNKSLLPSYPEVTDEDAFVHYYDLHPTKEDLMGESAAQSRLIVYLLQVLAWLYRADGWFVISNLNLYQRRDPHEYPVAPDIAVFKGVVIPDPSERTFRSWRLYEPQRPAPQVVFEVSSEGTWKEDLKAKPPRYAELGVREYYAYDPNNPPYWPASMGRLRGWWNEGGSMVEQRPDGQGRIWSAELDSWLVPDGAFLRLYDREGHLRLTENEAAWVAKEAERVAKEAERAAKEAAWAKLRALGIDPEHV